MLLKTLCWRHMGQIFAVKKGCFWLGHVQLSSVLAGSGLKKIDFHTTHVIGLLTVVSCTDLAEYCCCSERCCRPPCVDDVWHRVLSVSMLQMPEEEAFAILVKIMQEYRLREIFKPTMAELGLCMFQLEFMIQVRLRARAFRFFL